MKKTIAQIRLSRREIAYFDPITRIHLTINNPIAFVTSEMNVSNLKQALKYKVIQIVEGDLDGEVDIVSQGEDSNGDNQPTNFEQQENEQEKQESNADREEDLSQKDEQVIDTKALEAAQEKEFEAFDSEKVEEKKRGKKSKAEVK